MSERRTEMQHPAAIGLQAEAPLTVLERLLAGQRQAVASVGAALPAIAEAGALAAATLGGNRRLGYAGAGSSGLMALADALELAGTFGIVRARTPVLFAGGATGLAVLANAAEDDTGAALRDLDAAALGSGDAVICVSASGSTPYAVAVAEAARERGVAVVGIANSAGSPLLAAADVAVLLDSGPELVAGSTRMGAATAQKIALNLISTLAGVLLGQVHDGYMVGVVADNAKLRARAARIVAAIAGAGPEAAAAALAASGGEIKPAVLIAAGAGDRAAAEALLAASAGHVGPALERLRAGL